MEDALLNAEDLEFLEGLKEEFYPESIDSLSECEELILGLNDENKDESLTSYMRKIHSLKGSAQSIDLKGMSRLFHEMETIVRQYIDTSDESLVELTLKLIDSQILFIKLMKHKKDKDADHFLIEILDIVER